MEHEKIKNIVIYIITISLFLYFGYSTYYFYNLSLVDRSNILTYSTSDRSNYEVYYINTKLINGKSNGDSFIKKYIDKVIINYDYNIKLSDKVNTKTNYLIKATLVVYSPNGDAEIWRSSSNYLLKDTSKEFNNIKKINNKESVTIDYQKYLNLYEEFKKDTEIFSDAKILVEFMNNSNISYDSLKTFNKNDTTSFSIPVTDSTITITKNTSAQGIKYEKTDNTNLMKKEFKYLGNILLYLSISVLLLIFLLYKFIKYLNNRNEYHNTLRRILRDYDNIIINIKKVPKLTDKEVIEVIDFQELVDLELELRKPINFIEKKIDYEAWFLIISSDFVWIYKLINKKGDKNEKKKEK